MPKIIPIVEGDGDVQAVPLLLRRILHEHFQRYDWQIARPKKAHSLANLRNRLSSFIRYAEMEPDATHILILMDLDDGCPKEQAGQLAHQIREIHPRLPVSVVLAHREYEAWFLASLPALAGNTLLPAGCSYEGNPEQKRGAKEWLSNRLPPGVIYKETEDQPAWSAQLDIPLTASRSRSFRRLIHAVQEFIQRPADPFVSPQVRCE